MRGKDTQQSAMFSYVSPERRVPPDHPLRPIRRMVDVALQGLSRSFGRMYVDWGRPSIAPEKLLCAAIAGVVFDSQRADADGATGIQSLNHPEAPVQLKKRILRTALSEVVVESKPESPTHRVLLHWAGGVHTELQVERNRSGQHRRSADRTVIELVSELAKVCPDRVINQKDLGLPEVQLQVQAVRTGRLKGGVVCRSVPAGRCEGV
jgi:hypothetical protein